jgi:3-phenylpropionate/trans-cinnamate dioxygenase ferredoxin subunit
MEFIKVAKKEEITEGSSKPVEVSGKELLIINYNNSFYVINRRCTHLGGDLSKNNPDGKIVTCPRHGSQFDVTTGKSVKGPKMGFLKLKTKDVPVYEVKVEKDSILVKV